MGQFEHYFIAVEGREQICFLFFLATSQQVLTKQVLTLFEFFLSEKIYFKIQFLSIQFQVTYKKVFILSNFNWIPAKVAFRTVVALSNQMII